MKNESSPGLVALLERHGFIATGNVSEDLAIARLIMPAPYKDGYDKNTLVKRSIDRVDCDKTGLSVDVVLSVIRSEWKHDAR